MPRDEITVTVSEGRLQFTIRISGAEVTLTSMFPVVMGHWHQVHVQRYRTHAVLLLDDQPPVRGQAASTLSTLNLDQLSYIGHSPSLSLPGLQGCIKYLFINKIPISLVSKSDPHMVKVSGE